MENLSNLPVRICRITSVTPDAYTKTGKQVVIPGPVGVAPSPDVLQRNLRLRCLLPVLGVWGCDRQVGAAALGIDEWECEVFSIGAKL